MPCERLVRAETTIVDRPFSTTHAAAESTSFCQLLAKIVCCNHHMEIFLNDLFAGERYAVLAAFITYTLCMGSISIIGCIHIRRWPQTKGVLLEDGVTSFGTHTERTYHARVRYEYYVDGKRHIGSRLSPTFISATGTRIAQWQKSGIQRHGSGGVTVFYSPARPHKSYLIKPSLTTIIVVSAVTMVVVMAFWFGL